MARRRRRTPSYKLPDSQLSPTQLRNRQMIRRRRAQDRDPLLNPGAPLTGRNLASAVDRIVAGQFDPVERGYKQDIANTTTQGTALMGRAQDYYRQLAEQEQRGIQTQAALGSMLNQRLDSVGQQALQAADAAKSAEQQRLGQDAAVRGPGLQDTSTLNEIATLRANAAQNQASASTEAALGTSNWANFANALSQARGMRGGETQDRLANRVLNRNLKTQDDISDLAQKRAGVRTSTLLGLRQQGFENLATLKTLGLKEADLGLDAERIKTQADLARERLRQARKIAAANRRITARGQTLTAEQRRLDREARREIAAANRAARGGRGPGGAPRATPAAHARTREQIGLAQTWIRELSRGRGSSSDVRRILASGVGPIDPRDPTKTKRMKVPRLPKDIINAAFDLEVRGGLSPANVRALHAAGLSIGQLGLQTLTQRRRRRGPQGLPG